MSAINELLIWSCDMDQGKYTVTVHRLESALNKAQLTAIDNETGELKVSEIVNLSYGAQYGPDVADIDEWERLLSQRIPRE